MDAIWIGNLEQPLPQELRGAVGNLTISLHLSETETTVPGSALHGLTHQYLYRASRSRVNFVVHHMLEALVVGGTQEDLRLQLAPRVTIVHDLVSSQLVTVVIQQRRDFLHVDSIVEWGGITNFTSVCRNLGSTKLFFRILSTSVKMNSQNPNFQLFVSGQESLENQLDPKVLFY